MSPQAPEIRVPVRLDLTVSSIDVQRLRLAIDLSGVGLAEGGRPVSEWAEAIVAEYELLGTRSTVAHRFRPCEACGGSPDIHNANRGADFIGHDYR